VPVVRFWNASKEFPGVLAVDSVDLDILPDEVHVVAGEITLVILRTPSGVR
jgi:ABC-type sugar transport system ATPase subunit